MIRIYLIHAITGRVELPVGPLTEHNIRRALDEFRQIQKESKERLALMGLADNSYRPLKIVSADTVHRQRIGQLFVKAKITEIVCPL
jgi:tetrahydromethanopterin S-methyltransferase subunit H